MSPGAFLRRHALLVCTALLPAAAAGVYFGALASDVYLSESRFIVRSAQKADGANPLGEVFKGFSSAGSEDVLLVRDYLLAHEVIREVDQRLRLRRDYAQGDVLARFPAPWQPDSLEEFSGYYRDQVHVEVDPISSVGVLTVRAFSARMAHTLNVALLQMAQDRVAALSSKVRGETLELAQQQVAQAQDRLALADARLATFRTERALLDPERQGATELQAELELIGRRVVAESRLQQVRQLAPQSPQAAILEAEVQTLQAAARQLRSKVVGASADSRVHSAQDYQALNLEREVASRHLAAAQDTFVRARVDVERRHLYVETVSAPSLPDSALQPRRWRAVAASAALSLSAYAVIALVNLGVREHRQLI